MPPITDFRTRGVRHLGWIVPVAALGAGSLFAAPAASAPGIVTVRSHSLTAHYEAYARIEPIAVLPVRAVQAGVVDRLACLPGATVHRGDVLARLGGPQIQAQRQRDQGAVESAQSRVVAAQKALRVERRQLPSHLSTEQSVAAAASALASARAALSDARAMQDAHQRLAVLRAPSDGVVLAVDAADGEPVSAGRTLLTLQPAGRLWVRATYYGPDAAAIRPGMTGRFAPDGERPAIAVKVLTVFGAPAADGGEFVGLIASHPSPDWINGEFGKVTLDGATRSLVAVPTRALVLDQGRWWVLVHTAQGVRRQGVIPGPTRGWETFLESGLKPGDQIVVEDAYLSFHAGIAKRYAPPN